MIVEEKQQRLSLINLESEESFDVGEESVANELEFSKPEQRP